MPAGRPLLVRLNLNPVFGIGELSLVWFTELTHFSDVPVKSEAGSSRGCFAVAFVERFACE
jgi:hypothetical protein